MLKTVGTQSPAKVVLWDVGGTLASRILTPEASRRKALADAGIDPNRLSPAAVERAVHLIQAEMPTWRTPEDELAGLERAAAAMLDDEPGWNARALGLTIGQYFDSYAVVPGVVEVLAELAGMGVVQAVVSNWPPSLPAFLAYHELTDYFATVVGSGALGIEKPDPRLFEAALNQLKIGPAAAVYVGNDVERDILPARSLGMCAVHFSPVERDPEADAHDVDTLRRCLLRVLNVEDASWRHCAGK